MSYDVVPESAPFSSEQRAWLNGFFAGILGTLDVAPTRSASTSALAAAASMLSTPAATTGAAPTQHAADASVATIEEDFPWADPSLPSTDRMSLAADRPLPQRMMAAMGQLNCGSCGYLCKTYAEAIASGAEKNLTLCSPGGTETVKLLRQLNKERGESARTPVASSSGKPPSTATAVTIVAPSVDAVPNGRPQPVTAQLISSIPLNGKGSAKDTRHVAIDLRSTGLKYRVGDALGIFPTNCKDLVHSVCHAAGLDPQTTVSTAIGTSTLEAALGQRCLRSITSELCERAIQRITARPKTNGAAVADAALGQRVAEFADSDDFYQLDVYEFLLRFEPLDLTAHDLVEALSPLRPRLYSIASSQSHTPDEVHLTVGRVEEVIRDRPRKGVASTMLADRLEPGAGLQVFIQPSHGFTVPADPTAPMIMVGPGTGIAPFIAFLQQRACDGATGKNWLFFGDQKRECDFLYREQLTQWQKSGLLTRLDLAFSRDDRNKVYVQHRMRENGGELYRWLEAGGYFFVCGDARRMARDVEQTLLEIVAQQGSLSADESKAYIARLKQAKRYLCDVY